MKILKAVKVTFNGEPMRNVYPYATWYQVVWYKFLMFVRWTLIRVGIIAFGVAVMVVSVKQLPDRELHFSASTPVASADQTAESLALESIDDLKKEMIARIWKAESSTYKQINGSLLVTYDPTKAMKASGVCLVIGGKRPIDCDSYGPMMEKIGTIVYYWPKVYGKSITETDAFLVTQDMEKSQQFFLDCSIKIPGCVFNWTTAQTPENTTWFNIVLPIIRKAEGIN